MNREKMIVHLNTWFSTWFEIVEKFDGRGSNGWSTATLKNKGTVLLKHGELAISKLDFNPIKEEKPQNCIHHGYGLPTMLDDQGRPTVKHTMSFKKSVEEARMSTGHRMTPRKQALIDGEEYYMLDKPCITCDEIHERHVSNPCKNTKKKQKAKSKSNKSKVSEYIAKNKKEAEKVFDIVSFNSSYSFDEYMSNYFSSFEEKPEVIEKPKSSMTNTEMFDSNLAKERFNKMEMVAKSNAFNYISPTESDIAEAEPEWNPSFVKDVDEFLDKMTESEWLDSLPSDIPKMEVEELEVINIELSDYPLPENPTTYDWWWA